MKNTKPKVNPFLSILKSVFKAFSFVIGTIFVAMLLEWFGMHSWWHTASDNRLADRTEFEVQKIEDSFVLQTQTSRVMSSYHCLSKICDRYLESTEKYLFAQRRELEQVPDSMSSVVNSVVQIQISINEHLFVAIDVFRAWLFRFVVFLFGVISVLPLLMVGLIDGLVKREIRRWSGGRESAWIFAFAKQSLAPSLALSLAIYVLWPWTLSFAWINAFVGVYWCCALYLALAKFKKYL